MYPPLAPSAAGRVALDAQHTMHWEQSGAPDGVPVLFLHGGPGAGVTPTHRRFFDPHHYRAVLYDQRGAGKSTPAASLADNTTPHLVADIEALREHLGIDRWIVFGGSWGSTLALAYAAEHPDRVRALVLRGVFLCRPQEIDWFLHGMGRFFPEAHRAFSEHLPEDERGDLLGSYYRRLTEGALADQRAAAAAWSGYEAACSTLKPSPEVAAGVRDGRTALALARLEAHYLKHDAFFGDTPLLDRVARIRDKPGVIVQGRYDMVCPIESADALARVWPNAAFRIVDDAGHSALEPGIRAALVLAMEEFKTLD
ncbi:MAG: prolyl aminopeptidase [Alphaproteobacteria bacterium]